jgi:hypothetical protein
VTAGGVDGRGAGVPHRRRRRCRGGVREAHAQREAGAERDDQCPAAKIPRASISVTRRGSRRVSSAVDGAPTIIPTANTVISSPARATLMCRSPAISGSRPATTNSV